MTIRMIWAVAALVLLGTGLASAGERVALVIGNANYANEALNLKNPVNDAQALAASLSDLGFTVTRAIDQDRETLAQTLDGFERDMKGAEIALLFFAGHGVQLNGENHLLTAGFSRLDLSEIAHEAVTLGEIRRRFARANPDLGVIVLDACRNNPFTESGQVPRGLTRSQGSSGVLIAYATDPGNVAFDGTGDNSVFTEALIENIATPGLETRLMFGRVRQQVAIETTGLQVPWVEESVLGEYYFNGKEGLTTLDANVSADVEAWRRATLKNDNSAFRTYLDAFPDGLFRQFAEDRLETRQDSGLRLVASESKVAQILQQTDPQRTVAALVALGYLPSTRGILPESAEIERALVAWSGQVASEDELSADRLYLDAAQVVVILGAATAQRIRQDIANLTSLDIALETTESTFAQLEALAENEPNAAPLVLEAREDLTAIRRNRNLLLTRLDESRGYYAELLETGQSNFAPYLTRSLSGLRTQSRALAQFEQAIARDADSFIRHAAETADEEKHGSYGWIADFIPGS